ncbi:MAG TPA: hypothetical protein VJN22_05430 [Candidatus Eremiobacteraceae bacterium]|nr:hypothetical protein [Candidatus Eremiobacteraceae bacterium]
MITIAAATILSVALAAKPHRKHRPPVGRDISIAAERIERRRAVRLAIIAALTRREAALEDFLITTSSETPLFATREPAEVGALSVGPTLVGLDFLGSPTVRATVRNRSAKPITALLIAHIAYSGGRVSLASVALDSLAPGESRHVDLVCPSAVRPTALHWTIEEL